MLLHALVLATLAGLVVADFDSELHAKYISMPKSAFIDYFNSRNYSWKMADYGNQFEKYHLCELDGEPTLKLPVISHDLEEISLPTEFDSRTQWPQCESIKVILDQGNCGSCWTFGTSMTASDRTCIHKDIHVNLSQQDFECMKDNVCGGGYSREAFDFWKEHGLVTQECKPYDIEELRKSVCHTKCVNSGVEYQKDKHYADKVYRVEDNADQIKAELVKNGPIQASFKVYGDFKDYKSGIYVHTYGDFKGYHSVRVIGYGVEDGKDYWLVANSWGTGWGENGHFRIQTFQKELQFETVMNSGIPKN
uniref:Peptidase C1A papain C-terminal domain-containing protein n=1 Tax=Heliothis virescens TaxID=7102 RepID=A0A2A4JSC3_HELVI